MGCSLRFSMTDPPSTAPGAVRAGRTGASLRPPATVNETLFQVIL